MPDIPHARQGRLPFAAALLVCLLASFWLTPASAAASAPVNVFPIPGSHVAAPGAQIVFRGVPIGQLGMITVTGSRSGAHAGKVMSDSDGHGGSFLPAKPFTPGETVTVRTSLTIVGGQHGVFHFSVADPAGSIPFRTLVLAARTPGAIWQFASQPGMQPAAVRLTKRAPGGDIFLASQFGPAQDGPEIVGPDGKLVWFQQAPPNDAVSNFTVQRYLGQPVLTWWQGNVNAGNGRGEDVIYNTHYQLLATVQAANGLAADLHEFEITPSNTALITSYYPVYWNDSFVGGHKHEITFDGVMQEIDIRTGLLLYQWDSLDHVPPRASYYGAGTGPYDYFHINAIDVDRDGNFVISGRNTWAAYKVNSHTGATIWTLGGKNSTFRMEPGSSFAFQHDVRVHWGRNYFVTLFDDGGGPPNVENQSRGLKLVLNFRQRTATRVSQQEHSPPLLADYEGSYEGLANGNTFVGWGQAPYFTEFGRRGRVLLDGRFVGHTNTYRAFRFAWTGSPAQPPSVTAFNSANNTVVYASWNGATRVASWRILGGSTPAPLQPIATAARSGFETHVSVPGQRYIAAQALDSGGHVLGQSATVAPG